MPNFQINHLVHTYPGLRFSNLAKSVAYGVVKDSIREAYVHCASFMNKTRGFDSYTEGKKGWKGRGGRKERSWKGQLASLLARCNISINLRA